MSVAVRLNQISSSLSSRIKKVSLKDSRKFSKLAFLKSKEPNLLLLQNKKPSEWWKTELSDLHCPEDRLFKYRLAKEVLSWVLFKLLANKRQ
jgi:hypothetical protein